MKMQLNISHRNHWKAWIRPRGKDAFVMSLPQNCRLMDVGCGNNSPIRVKNLRKDIYYIGVDVQDYEQSTTSKTVADEYIITSPENFISEISAKLETMDAILSSHNLEHCNKRKDVLVAMCGGLKLGGQMYLSFPSEASLNMPSRHGTLNYHDDKTHVALPPNWQDVTTILNRCGMEIIFARKQYRPLIPFLLGLLLEPWSHLMRRVGPLGSTWALFGFETVIWARKVR